MPRKYLVLLFLVLVVFTGLSTEAQAKPEFFARIPDNYEKSCNLCHVAPPVLNNFGKSFKAAGFSFEKLSELQSKPKENETLSSGTAPKPAAALSTILKLTMPENVPRGEQVEIQARLEDATGKPVVGAVVSFAAPASLFIDGNMSISEVRTNSDGVARVRFIPRFEKQAEIIAQYKGGEGYQPTVSRSIMMLTGDSPLYQTDWTMKAPFFISTWLILLAVSIVWTAYFVTYAQLVAIRRDKDVPAPAVQEADEEKAMAQ